jgi:hypothetical protein
MAGTSMAMKLYPTDTIIELEGECINIKMYIRQGLGLSCSDRIWSVISFNMVSAPRRTSVNGFEFALVDTVH